MKEEEEVTEKMLQRVTHRTGDKGPVLAMQQHQVQRKGEKPHRGQRRVGGREGWRQHHIVWVTTNAADYNPLVREERINFPDLSQQRKPNHS